jgi:hypothetical protein
VQADAVASAGFVHRVSRALDPHLHSGREGQGGTKRAETGHHGAGPAGRAGPRRGEGVGGFGAYPRSAKSASGMVSQS